jgi:hypothetical protein
MNRGGAVARLQQIEQTFTVTAAPPSLSETADPVVVCQLQQGA